MRVSAVGVQVPPGPTGCCGTTSSPAITTLQAAGRTGDEFVPTFSGHGGVLLREGIDAVHRNRDLANPAGLLGRLTGDLGDQRADLSDARHDGPCRSGVSHRGHPDPDALLAACDQHLDLAGGLRRSLRQSPRFPGDHGKTLAGVNPGFSVPLRMNNLHSNDS